MIQLRFQKQLQRFPGIDPTLMSHLQSLTDNLASVITRGLSFNDNLNSKIVKVSVTSGRAFSLNAKELPVISGASIINTGGAVVKSQKIATTTRGDLDVVLELDKDATITFLIIGE